MSLLRKAWPIWLVVVSGAACAGLVGAIRVAEPDSIRFPHEKHIKGGLECVACHESVFDAEDLKEHHLPEEAKCMECHRAKKEAGECRMCHTSPASIQPRPAPENAIKFNHWKHIELMNEECTRCHTQLPEPGRPGAKPEMRACFQSCHDTTVKNEHPVQFAEGRCSTCHNDLWRKPLKPESSFAHDGDFLRQHPMSARSAGAACSQCHEQNFCSDCHGGTIATGPNKLKFDRVDRNFIHRGNWIAQHPTEANADPASCERCHTPSSCESCHDARRFGAGGVNPRNPHPKGWAFPGSTEFHGEAAQREISSCVACHDQGGKPDCIRCHKSGGPGGNPHPQDFMLRTKSVDRRNPMCLECHL